MYINLMLLAYILGAISIFILGFIVGYKYGYEYGYNRNPFNRSKE